MKITWKQKLILNSFSCKRISKDKRSLEKIQNFHSRKGKQLVKYLRENGLEEDESGETAFYLISNRFGLPLLFFSLKCGSLFSPFNISDYEEDAKRTEWLLSLLNEERDENNEQQNIIYEQLEQVARKENKKISEVIRRAKLSLALRYGKSQAKAESYHRDMITDENDSILRVGKTLPGIELMHFCSNDNAKSYWKKLKFNHPMGEVLFWRFIIPTVIQTQKIVGCQFLYLFAADTSEDRSLVNYYNVALKFEKPDGMIGTNKPFYDYCCEFMIQEIAVVIHARKDYFAHFNIDRWEDAV